MVDDLGIRMVRLRVNRAEEEDDARIAAVRKARREAELKKNPRPRKSVAYYLGRIAHYLGRIAHREVEL